MRRRTCAIPSGSEARRLGAELAGMPLRMPRRPAPKPSVSCSMPGHYNRSRAIDGYDEHQGAWVGRLSFHLAKGKRATPERRSARGNGVTFFTALERSDPTPTSESDRERDAAGEGARDNAGVVAPPPLIFLGGPRGRVRARGAAAGDVGAGSHPVGLGGVLFVAGLVLLVWFNTAFGRKGTGSSRGSR